MTHGTMGSIVVTIRITVRIQESEVRIHWILAFSRGLRSLSTSSHYYTITITYIITSILLVL